MSTLLVTWCMPAHAQQPVQTPVTLRPAFKPGDAATYEFWSRRESARTIRFNDQERTAGTTLHSEGHVRWVIDRVRPDGSATATMTLLWMTADLTDPQGNTQRNDSRKGTGEVEPIHQLLVAMAGKPIRIDLRPDGSIEKAQGIDAIQNAIGPDLAEIVPDETDFMETASDLATLPYAPAQADVGDQWDATYRWNHEMGHTDQTWRYTLSTIETIEGVPVAVIDGTGKLSLEPDFSDAPPDAPRPQVKLAEAQASSQVMFDLSTQEAVGRHANIRTVIDVRLDMPDGKTLTQTLTETNQSQVLRIAEE